MVEGAWCRSPAPLRQRFALPPPRPGEEPLEIHREAAVDEPPVEAERREDRERDEFLVDRIDSADRRRPRAERRAIGIDVEDVVRTDRQLEPVLGLPP